MRNKIRTTTTAVVLLCQFFMSSLVFAGSRDMPPQYSSDSASVNDDGYMGLPRESEMSLSLERRLQSKNKMTPGVESTFEYRDVTITFGRHMTRPQREEVLKAIDYIKDNYEPLWGNPVKNARLSMYFPSFAAESMRYAAEFYSPENGYSKTVLLKEIRYLREHGHETSMAYTLTHRNGTSIVIVDSSDIRSFRGIVFHEMTHYYQQIFGGLDTGDGVDWFKEGQASSNEDVIFANGSKAYQGIVYDNISKYRSLMQLSATFASPANGGDRDSVRKYNLSYHAVKYLGETYGQQKLVDFTKYLANNPSAKMNQSLRNFFGISIERLNSIAMEAVAKDQEEINEAGKDRKENYHHFND